MIPQIEITKAELLGFIRAKTIKFGGNRMLKIYGKLDCKSGKGMKNENCVLYYNEN
jgi:hypothetical protein